MKEIQGHGVAMITPFKKDGSVDFDAIPVIVNHLISGGVDFIVVLGTTAETATLSKDEKISSVIKRAGGLTNYAYMDGVKMYRKFEVIAKEEAEVNLSDELKETILSNPELAIIYANDLREN